MTHVSRYHEIDVSRPMAGLRYEKMGGIALVTIDRPERGNALAPSMHAMFRAVWSDVRDELEKAVTQYLFRWLADKERSSAKIEFTGATPHFRPGTEEVAPAAVSTSP